MVLDKNLRLDRRSCATKNGIFKFGWAGPRRDQDTKTYTAQHRLWFYNLPRRVLDHHICCGHLSVLDEWYDIWHQRLPGPLGFYSTYFMNTLKCQESYECNRRFSPFYMLVCISLRHGEMMMLEGKDLRLKDYTLWFLSSFDWEYYFGSLGL